MSKHGAEIPNLVEERSCEVTVDRHSSHLLLMRPMTSRNDAVVNNDNATKCDKPAPSHEVSETITSPAFDRFDP